MTKLKLRPLADRLVVEPIEQQDRTETGLYLPETAKEKPQQGRVLAVGPGTYREGSSERIPLDVKEGDRVLFGKYAGTDVKLNGTELKILKESDVLAIIEEE
ncbi:MAG TPA: co-chaperone GroES [Chloroflexi bacterium]|nr:co-chaperone GroES [Chloroflexota bacterium]